MIELQSAAPGIGTRNVTTVGNVKHKQIYTLQVSSQRPSQI